MGRVNTAAALERSEGLRRQAVGTLERRIGDVLDDWDLCVAGDLFPERQAGSESGGAGKGGGGGGDGSGDRAAADSGEWRPLLAANPVLAVTAPGVVNVPGVVVSLCHSASPVLQRRVLELAKRYEPAVYVHVMCPLHGRVGGARHAYLIRGVNRRQAWRDDSERERERE